MERLNIDIETYSEADLTKSGVYKYVDKSSGFEVLLFGYAVDGGPVKVIDLASGEMIPQEIIKALQDPKVLKYAFNAQFERVCLSAYLGKYLEPESWRCTMVASLYLGLPGSLAQVGTVLGVEKQKLESGKDLIKYFSIPCKATKTNGGRTRNIPENAPDKWQQFKEYNKRDVETEMEIFNRVNMFPVPDFLWKQYAEDQRINDLGIEMDMDLVSQAIKCDEEFRAKYLKRAQQLTGLENPNSPIQLKEWIQSKGVEMESLAKAEVAEVMDTVTGDVKEVLELRQLLSKSSVKKYAAMENCRCSDGRAHGLLQFYGANRTGRWAGRLIQVQNLPQNHIPDLKVARDLVKNGCFEVIELLYDSIPDTLSQLIRTAFVPKSGCKFIVADFSAIEARVIAWLSNKLHQMANGAVYDENGNVRRIHDRKLDAVEDLIEAANGKPVMIAYWFKHDRERLIERFGAVPIDKSEDITKWNKGEIPVAIIHPASAGHGLNLQEGGCHLIWFGLTWSLELYQQCNARLWRQGQKHTVTIQHVITKGTIDEDVLLALECKEVTQEALLQAVKARILDGKE